jgi:hypothetical protein
MARGDLLCPIDGTIMGLPTWSILGDPAERGETEDHIHIVPTNDFLCVNGHRWRATAGQNLTLGRVR